MLATLRSCAPATRVCLARLPYLAMGGWTGAFFPSMLTDSRFVDREFPILIQREVLDHCPEKRHDFSYAATRKGRKRGKFPILFPVNGNLPARRPVRPDCVRHQVVGANGPGFPTPTIRRQFSALARKPMVCRVYSAVTTRLGRRTRERVSDAEFWVPDCAAATNMRINLFLRRCLG
jgi:hypothetical protein